MKILIVDDSINISRAVEALLLPEGHDVVKAEDGFVALSVFRAEQPDFVFMDIDMPLIDGYKATQLIRSQSSVPIVFLSSNGTVFDQARADLVGGTDFIVKPFSKDSVLSAIARHSS